jgi:quercetin dioxygenase-like cupin family protein
MSMPYLEKRPNLLAALALLLTVVAVALMARRAAAVSAPEAKVSTVISKELPNVPGKEAQILMVEYPPGGADPVHRHDANAFAYVLEGSVVMGVKGQPEVTLEPGQVFYEGPSDIHTVGRNASSTKPAKFVVFLVKEKGAPVMLPAK